MWSPRLDPALAAAIKPHFLATFDHLAELGNRFRQQLAGLLAFASIEIYSVISAGEAKEALSKLDEDGRATVAHWLERKLEGAGNRAASLWRQTVGPWLQAAWPRETRLHGSKSSINLALAATKAGSAFPEAVTTVLGLLGQISSGDRLIRTLAKTEAAQSHPRSALSLMNTVTPDNPAGQFWQLREFTDWIAQADPALRDTPEFRRLRDAALRGSA